VSTKASCFAALLACVVAASLPGPASAENPWPSLANDVFKGRPIQDGTGLLALDMPGRAEDAAVVPLTFRATLPAGDPRRLTGVTIVVDENPAPVAGTFMLGSGVNQLSTRVRIDNYTPVHAVGELSDGKLYAVSTFVKASGGCSAPVAKSADPARIGEMKFRVFAAAPQAGSRQAQFMIRHPNNSGLQMDQLTHLYIPAFFVRELRIWQGDELVLAMDGGISISQNPNLRFSYVPNGAKTFRAEAIDTEEHRFRGEWPADPPEM
jgi:sulfur-oxidizing protein SoxY